MVKFSEIFSIKKTPHHSLVRSFAPFAVVKNLSRKLHQPSAKRTNLVRTAIVKNRGLADGIEPTTGVALIHTEDSPRRTHDIGITICTALVKIGENLADEGITECFVGHFHFSFISCLLFVCILYCLFLSCQVNRSNFSCHLRNGETFACASYPQWFLWRLKKWEQICAF